MKKFKIGDEVRCVTLRDGITENKIYTVIDITVNSRTIYIINDNNLNTDYPSHFFELTQESELKQLVDKVNAGKDALRKIYKDYPGKTRYEDKTLKYPLIGINRESGAFFGVPDCNDHIEVIPGPQKPQFQPFQVGPNKEWICKVDGDHALTIGCKAFSLDTVKEIIKASTAGYSFIISSVISFTRRGVIIGSSLLTEYLPYEDLDKIEAELKRCELI